MRQQPSFVRVVRTSAAPRRRSRAPRTTLPSPRRSSYPRRGRAALAHGRRRPSSRRSTTAATGPPAHLCAQATLVGLPSPTAGALPKSRWTRRGTGWAEALPLQLASHDSLGCASHPITRVACPPRGGLDFHLVDYPSGMWGGERLAPLRLHIPVAGAPSGGLGAVQVRLLCLEPSLTAPRAPPT